MTYAYGHAKRLALLVAAVAAMGCCPVRWPSSQRLAPAQSYVRYVAQAVREGDRQCAEAAKTAAEAQACVDVFNALKDTVLKMEAP